MGDALIVGRGGGGSASSKYEVKKEIYEADKLWVVPKAKDQKFSVRIFGGGGAGGGMYGASGGGGGFMNNGDLTLSQGSTVQITIGLGGKYNIDARYQNSGGTTSFGTVHVLLDSIISTFNFPCEEPLPPLLTIKESPIIKVYTFLSVEEGAFNLPLFIYEEE